MTLESLARKYGSDKFEHGFCPFYERFFGPVREEVKAVLEIGIADGASIRMWLDYFPNALVYGLDNGMYGNRDRWPLEEPRFEAFLGDQSNKEHMRRVIGNGPYDIAIDDGSHTMFDQICFIKGLLPVTKRFLVVEDLHTSFMDEIVLYGDGKRLKSYKTGADGPETAFDHILRRYPGAEIFDRDGDKRHMTAVIEGEYDA